MKKTYIQPELEAIDIKVSTMLCASFGFTDMEFDNGDALAPSLDEGFDFGDDNAFLFEEETFDYGE